MSVLNQERSKMVMMDDCNLLDVCLEMVKGKFDDMDNLIEECPEPIEVVKLKLLRDKMLRLCANERGMHGRVLCSEGEGD